MSCQLSRPLIFGLCNTTKSRSKKKVQVQLVKSILLLVVVSFVMSFFMLAYNGLALGEGGDFYRKC
jgi:hypothetical protein